MKAKINLRFYLFAIIGITSVSLFLIRCKKSDDWKNDLNYKASKTNNTNSDKGYSYFEATMSSNEDLTNMYFETKKVMVFMRRELLLQYKPQSATTLKKSKDQIQTEFREAASRVDKKSLILKEMVKGVNNEKKLLEVEQFLFGSNSRVIIESTEKRKNYFLNFIKLNPEFTKLSSKQQVDLLVFTMKEIGLKQKNIFRQSQESQGSDCYAESDVRNQANERLFRTNDMLADAGLAICIIGTEGVATPLCLDAWMAGQALNVANFWINVAYDIQDLNTCINN